jgi:hypothetical protein
MQVPVAAVMVMVAEPNPLPEQAPLDAMLTGRPELAVAATMKVLLSAALAGAAVVTVMVWLVWLEAGLTVSVTGALAMFPIMAVICVVPVPTPVAKPWVAPKEATAGVEEVQTTVVVMFCVLPSL